MRNCENKEILRKKKTEKNNNNEHVDLKKI